VPVRVTLGNLSAAAGADINLKGLIPTPIHRVISAVILAGRTVNENGTATYDILSASSVTVTLVDEYTIRLGSAITTKDLLQLVYVSKTEFVAP
jgi:hypothetical protein